MANARFTRTSADKLPEVLGDSLARGLAKHQARSARDRFLVAMRDPRNRPKASRFGAVVRARKKLAAEFGALPVYEIRSGKRDLTLLFLCPEESGAWSLAVDFVHSNSAKVPANPTNIGGGISQHAMQRVLQAKLGSKDAAIAMTKVIQMTGAFGEPLSGRMAEDRGLWVWSEGWLVTFIPENALDARRPEWQAIRDDGGWRPGC